MKQSREKECWLQVSLAAPLPALDAFADFLCSIGATGAVFSDDPAKRKDIEVMTSFIPEDEKLDSRLEKIHAFINDLRAIWPEEMIGEIETKAVIEKDWLLEWRKRLKPVRAGSKIWVVPTWLPVPKEARGKGMKVIRLDPGMAFGVGSHETTRRCLEILEKLSPLDGKSVLDVGTGTGILAMAACRLGAGRVEAIDVDPEAVRTAKDNIKANRLSSKIIVRKTRADVKAGDKGKKFDIILANLFAQELIRIPEFFRKYLKEKGRLILSGILKDQADEVMEVYVDRGFGLVERFEDKDWISLLMEME